MKPMVSESTKTGAPLGGLAGWLLGRLQAGRRAQPRLELIERITLAPRQSLALVEAEGRRFLVATSPEGAPAFYPLEHLADHDLRNGPGQTLPVRRFPSRNTKPGGERSTAGRVSW
jgi:flagellar biogenesis protein FliO